MLRACACVCVVSLLHVHMHLFVAFARVRASRSKRDTNAKHAARSRRRLRISYSACCSSRFCMHVNVKRCGVWRAPSQNTKHTHITKHTYTHTPYALAALCVAFAMRYECQDYAGAMRVCVCSPCAPRRASANVSTINKIECTHARCASIAQNVYAKCLRA